MSSFLGIELGTRALRSFQNALNVTGHNISNINTPGYSRQRAVMQSTPPLVLGGRLIAGTGVMTHQIERIRDLMLEQQVNYSTSQQSRFTAAYQQLRQIEGYFNEPSEQGLSQRMTELFNAFSELATRPDSLTVRQTVIQRLNAMTSTFRDLDRNMGVSDAQLQETVVNKVREINQIATEIARVNERIRAATASSAPANDLTDQRDQLVARLSQLAGARVSYAQDGSVMVFVGEHTLVQDYQAIPLPTTLDVANNALTGTSTSIHITQGELRGLFDSLNNLRSYRADLNTLANTLISEFNTTHQAGFDLNGNTGLNLLTGTGAGDIRLSNDITGPERLAAASLVDTPGNGDIARALSDFRTTSLAALGNTSLTSFYTTLVGRAASEIQTYKNGQESQKLIVEHLQNLREAVSGVSLDEEASNLVRYQRSYQAAAKMVSTFDSLIGDLLTYVAPR